VARLDHDHQEKRKHPCMLISYIMSFLHIIHHRAARMPTNWTRLSEIDHLDSIGTNAVLRTAREIKRAVGDKGLYDSVVLKVARAMVERKISPTRVGEICDYIAVMRGKPPKEGGIRKSPGRYFVAAVKAEFVKGGIRWHHDDAGDES
jgi:hypothetical protein